MIAGFGCGSRVLRPCGKVEHSATPRVCLRMRCVRIPRGILAILCMLAGVCCHAASSPNVERRITRLDGSTITHQQVDATVNQLLEAAHGRGGGIGLFEARRIAYLKAYGLRDTKERLPLTSVSVMTSASLSK